MILLIKVGSDGFEPPKASPIDLQSTPFGHSGNSPNDVTKIVKKMNIPTGAGCQIRTDDPEITNHVLWPTELIRLIFVTKFV